MKKIIAIVALALSMVGGAYAQSAAELAKEQQQLDKINRKALEMKPTKEAKKQAKKFEKEGYTVMAGEPTIAQQITRGQLMQAELMADENGNPTKRYLVHSGMTTAGTYNAAYAAARANCLTEVAAMLETQIASAVQTKVDNQENNAISATTVDKLNQRMKAVSKNCLSNNIPVLTMYRRLKNNNFEVQVRIGFDKKEMAARVKRELQKALEEEGDEELMGLVDDAVSDMVGQ